MLGLQKSVQKFHCSETGLQTTFPPSGRSSVRRSRTQTGMFTTISPSEDIPLDVSANGGNLLISGIGHTVDPTQLTCRYEASGEGSAADEV